MDKAYCENGCELTEDEIRYHAGLPGDNLGTCCDGCSGGPSKDSMEAGWRGWTEPSQQQVEGFVASHGKGWRQGW